MKYSIVLPCYNESANIPVVVERFKRFAANWDFELVLVNNGSTDETAEVMAAIQSGGDGEFVRVVTINQNIGYGHGIHAGLSAARGEILAYSHADAQTPPEDIFRAFELIESGEVDITRGIIRGLRPGRDGASVLTRWLRIITATLTGVNVEDINGQPKVFHRSLLETMGQPPMDFSYDTYVFWAGAREGLDVNSIEVSFDQRLHGESKWASTLLKKYKTIAKYLESIFLMGWRDWRRKDNPIGQVLRFGLSGAVTNTTNYVTFIVLLWAVGLDPVVCSVAGFFAGFVVGFFLNRSFVFGIAGTNMAHELWKFLIVNLASLGANTVTIYLAVKVIGIWPELGQVLAILVSAIVNFCGMKFWVFAKRGGALEGSGAHI